MLWALVWYAGASIDQTRMRWRMPDYRRHLRSGHGDCVWLANLRVSCRHPLPTFDILSLLSSS